MVHEAGRPRAASLVRQAALSPLWAAQLLTGAKSFMDNPLIRSRRLGSLSSWLAFVRPRSIWSSQ